MNLNVIRTLHNVIKSQVLYGRYVTNLHIEKCFKNLSKPLVSVLGYSVEKRPIYTLSIGKGTTKVLLWSQMHGNETTTTKALFDCLNGFETKNKSFQSIFDTCTLCIIPILNPDGAERYTRLNANEVDLNRDAQNLSQPESKVLRQIYEEFKPDFCFNLHGQRTIYNVKGSNTSAILSFLSPSQDSLCSLTHNRKVAMSIIYEINAVLQKEIPKAITRYDDSFNLDCVGDTFQSLGIPTLLYEAGHYPNDYVREKTRYLIFIAILKGLELISRGVDDSNYKKYFKIPENAKCFYDIIIKNVRLNADRGGLTDIGIQYEERLINGLIKFIPKIERVSKLNNFYGHREVDAKGNFINSTLKVGNEIDFILVNNERIVFKP